MQPSRYHVHNPSDGFPGELDVHGAIPRLRYQDFDRTGAEVYVSYFERVQPDNPGELERRARGDAVLQRGLSRHNLLSYDRARMRPFYEFQFVSERDHWIHHVVPAPPVDPWTLVVWWRRPIRVLRETRGNYQFPFPLNEPMMFFCRTSGLVAFQAEILSFSQEPARAATGYMVLRLTQASRFIQEWVMAGMEPAGVVPLQRLQNRRFGGTSALARVRGSSTRRLPLQSAGQT